METELTKVIKQRQNEYFHIGKKLVENRVNYVLDRYQKGYASAEECMEDLKRLIDD